MPLVLGIDAAWTETGSSGVALLRIANGKRSVLEVTSSYAGFLTTGVDGRRTPGTHPDVEAVLRRAENIAGAVVNVVAIDMPIARTKSIGRRVADDAVSKAFGASSASTHTPDAERPGLHGERIADAFAKAGYPLATDSLTSGFAPRARRSIPAGGLGTPDECYGSPPVQSGENGPILAAAIAGPADRSSFEDLGRYSCCSRPRNIGFALRTTGSLETKVCGGAEAL